MDIVDQIIFFFIAFAFIGGALKLAFWFSLFSGIFRNLGGIQSNPWLALFGISPPPPNPFLVDVRQRHRYAIAGLMLGAGMILLGVVMIVTGAGGGDKSTFEFFGLKVNQATPGVVFALLGTYVVKVTGERK